MSSIWSRLGIKFMFYLFAIILITESQAEFRSKGCEEKFENITFQFLDSSNTKAQM